jgi:hypothetical protein
MNRTRKELIKHAKERGYNQEAIWKISGFLIGVGMKDESEFIVWKIGKHTWADFMAWYNGQDVKKSVVETLAEDIFKNIDNAKNEEERERYQAQMTWLCKNHINLLDKRKKRE